ncbi:MAG: ACT domain-containing protein [Niameybacter sp.]|uniref:ACT domain-containing protein n=1 Tax=Niameybacter sp. TaxID=2033640 RepID=UPI002FC82B72
MRENKQFYIIDKEVLPEVFLKVMEVKNLLETQKGMTVQEATEKVGISRSSFYKYKDSIMPFYEKGGGQTITILIRLKDEAGRLSELLNYIASLGGNILTINQMIPMNGVALINICMETQDVQMGIGTFMEKLQIIDGVQSIKLLARE